MHTTDTFLRHFHDLTTPRPSDRELLRRFAGQRDEAAFGTLVRRHGRMVLGVCRRALGNGPDAEDAFQATFLVLATRAASGSWQDSVAGWLHGVAHHVALKARAAAARRRLRESRAPTRAAGDPLEEINGRELRGVLDEELSRLSEKYRVPLVLCYLEGATRDEAARQLGWPVGTLKSRVERGRELLRARLRRRGLALAAALSASALPADAAPPAALALETARAAVTTAAGRTSSGVASAPAVRLARAVLRGPLLTRLQGAVVLVVAAGLVAVAAGHRGAAPAGPGGRRPRGAVPPRPAARPAAGRRRRPPGHGPLPPRRQH